VKSCVTCYVFAFLFTFAPASTYAECILTTADMLLKRPSSEVVFRGTVVEVTRTADFGYRATFAVDRVWKGSVTKRFDLWVYELAPEIPRFEVGSRYVAAAHRLTNPTHRLGAGLNDSAVVFTPAFCSDSFSLAKDVESQLGPGYPPQ